MSGKSGKEKAAWPHSNFKCVAGNVSFENWPLQMRCSAVLSKAVSFPGKPQFLSFLLFTLRPHHPHPQHTHAHHTLRPSPPMLIGAHHRPEGYVWEITTRMKTENLVAAWPRSELSYCVVSLMIQSCLTVCFLWVGSLSDGVFVNECRSIEALGMCWWWRFYKTKARHFSRAIWIWTQVIFFTNIAYFSQADQKRLTPQPPWSTTSFFWTSHKWNLPTTPPPHTHHHHHHHEHWCGRFWASCSLFKVYNNLL